MLGFNGRIKLLWGLSFALFCPFSVFATAPLKNLKLHSHAAILIDADTKQVLYSKNADKKLAPASITKVPTLVYALKKSRGKLDKTVVADQDCIGMITQKYRDKMKYNYPAHWNVVSGTHLSIHNKEVLKIKDLMYGMMVASANDAANLVAKHTGGSIPSFMKELNRYLKEIGCKNTHFKNPHGMHYPNHHTTAYDMAIITAEGLKDPIFKQIFNSREYQLPATNKQKARKIKVYNKLIKEGHTYYYPYVIGSKCGYHNQALGTLVAAAKKNGKTLILVLLKCPKQHQKYEDAHLLFNEGFKLLNKK